MVDPSTSVQGITPLGAGVEASVKSGIPSKGVQEPKGAGNVASKTIEAETTAKNKRAKADATVGKALKMAVAIL